MYNFHWFSWIFKTLIAVRSCYTRTKPMPEFWNLYADASRRWLPWSETPPFHRGPWVRCLGREPTEANGSVRVFIAVGMPKAGNHPQILWCKFCYSPVQDVGLDLSPHFNGLKFRLAAAHDGESGATELEDEGGEEKRCLLDLFFWGSDGCGSKWKTWGTTDFSLVCY